MINRVTLVGSLGRDPEVRSLQNTKVANLSIATSEFWKDKKSGERKTNTEWHRVVVFGSLADVAEKWLRKGSKVYIEGKLRTRKYEKDGQTHYSTEVVVSGPAAVLRNLTPREKATAQAADEPGAHEPEDQGGAGNPDDEIPF